MIRLAILVTLFIAWPAFSQDKALATKEPAAKLNKNAPAELEKLQGTWDCVLRTIGEKELYPSQGKLILEISGDQCAEGTLILDAATKPKSLDLKLSVGDDKGKTMKGIYEFRDGKLVWCFNNDVNGPRPASFDAAKHSESMEVCVFEFAGGQELPSARQRVKDIERSVQKILKAEDLSGANEGFGELFKIAGLRSLQDHAHDSIALRAAWRAVELTVPKNPPDVVRPDRDKLHWFLGFLEGRARVQAPSWWAEALLDCRANRRDNIYAGYGCWGT